MDIVVFCNKDGKLDVDSDFRIIEVCKEDEYQINDIINNSIKNKFNLTPVHVLEEKEFTEMRNNSIEWGKYKEWKKAKEIYEERRKNYEDTDYEI